MDGNRARALLGVRPHASTDEIRDAFRRAVRAAHPDRGGEPAAFRALVAARDLLLATSTPASRSCSWPAVDVPRATVDLIDVVRPRPATSVATAPAPDFDAVLATMLVA